MVLLLHIKFIVSYVGRSPYETLNYFCKSTPDGVFYFRYEAWVIYNFLSLCLAWVGGPGAVVLSLSGRVLKPSVCLMTGCFPPLPLDG